MISGINGGGYSAGNMEAMRQGRFKKIDQDGDGKLTKDELKAGMPQNGRGPSVDDIFTKVDTNQDGAIDETEDRAAFEAMQKNGPPGGPPNPAQMASQIFKHADGDGDGKILLSDLTQLLSKGQTDSGVQDLFNAADSDEDGSITQSELEQSLHKLMEQMRENRTSGYDRSGGAREGATTGSFSAVA
jgi:Ca2+-binding EF-hand superfamily protein